MSETTSTTNSTTSESVSSTKISESTQQQQPPAQPDVVANTPLVTAANLANYEQSVTDKENTLINSFSNLIVSNHTSVVGGGDLLLLQHQTSNGVAAPKTNGKAAAVLNFDTVNEDDDVILRNANGAPPLTTNGNGHTDHSLDNKM